VDREEASQLVGRKVAVRLNSVEARGVEIIATLDEVRDDGLALSEVGELGTGPTMFCPWESLRRVRERPPWLAPPHEEPGPEEWESYELREISTEEAGPEPPVEGRREPSTRTLERVAPIAQKQTVGGITVAMVSLEIHGNGLGDLRWRVSFGEESPVGFDFGIPEPEFVVRDGSGRELPWSPRNSGSSGDEADGDVLVEGLPDAGGLEVEVTRLAADVYGHGEYTGEETPREGPWTFRFVI